MKRFFRSIVILFVVVLLFVSCSSSGWTYINLDNAKLQAIQKSVDEGHQPGYLDKENVAYEFASQHKFHLADGAKVECKEKGEDFICSVKLKDGKTLELWLTQPVKKGKAGIWVVKAYREK
ncbi:hypothetical protein GM182_06100 [bacterium 3DAC]|nr:hypothetical protein GM182_06100 [bacterium 3DAC]